MSYGAITKNITKQGGGGAPGGIKKELEFPRWPRKNSVELPGILVSDLEISKGSN